MANSTVINVATFGSRSQLVEVAFHDGYAMVVSRTNAGALHVSGGLLSSQQPHGHVWDQDDYHCVEARRVAGHLI
jgi:hypothetical protein